MNKLSPLVSVIMPAYNVARYVAEAIQSVLRQRGPNFELLIGDDHSTDGTLAILHRFKKDKRIRIFEKRAHIGEGALRQFLIGRSKGRYISICDADDLMLPGNLRRLSNALATHPQHGLACGTLLTGQSLGSKNKRLIFLPSIEKTFTLLTRRFPHGGALFRRRLWENIGGYRTDLRVGTDYDFLLRCAEKTTFYVEKGKPVYFIRKRPGSLSALPLSVHRRYLTAIRQEAIRRRWGIVAQWKNHATRKRPETL